MSRRIRKIIKMKKLILSLIAIVLISFSTYASNLKESFSAQVNISSTELIENQEINSNVSIGFNSIQSLNEFDFEQLNTGAQLCDVTVSVSIGVVSISITAKDIDCSQVGATIRRLKAMAMKWID